MENDMNIVYKLLFPKQYRAFLNEGQPEVKDLSRDRNWIESIITPDILKSNYCLKSKIYYHAKNDAKLSRKKVLFKYNPGHKSRRLITSMGNNIMESKFREILGVEDIVLSPIKMDFEKDILENPKICTALGMSEIYGDELSCPDQSKERAEYEIFLLRAYSADKNDLLFKSAPWEKEAFCKKLFGDWHFDSELYGANSEWNDFQNFVVSYNGKDLWGKYLDRFKKNDAIDTIERNNHSKETKTNSPKYEISEYLARFFYDMIHTMRYNPIIHTWSISEPLSAKNISECRKNTWKKCGLNDEEIKKIRKVYTMVDYAKRRIEHSYFRMSYIMFVKKYVHHLSGLKDGIPRNDDLNKIEKCNLYFFEQVYGFSYINTVTELLMEKSEVYNIFLDTGQWEYLGRILVNIMEEFEPLIRNKLAEQVIDWYFMLFTIQSKKPYLIESYSINDTGTIDAVEDLLEKIYYIFGDMMGNCRLYIENWEKDQIQKNSTCNKENAMFVSEDFENFNYDWYVKLMNYDIKSGKDVDKYLDQKKNYFEWLMINLHKYFWDSNYLKNYIMKKSE